jgi:alpha-glucosidase (family GH31 glycosyl hydrolase)
LCRRTLGLAPALAATLMAAGVHRVALPDGEAHIRWVTESTFHYCRAWAGERCAADRDVNSADVKVVATEDDSHIRLGTEFLVVSIDKADGRLRVASSRGEPLVAELSPAARTGRGITADRSLSDGENLYGFGARGATSADARGTVIDSERPFVVSSAGYGMYYDGGGSYRFDLGAARPDRWTVTAQGARRLEYYFYFGPGYKGILEEHSEVAQPAASHLPGILRPDQVPPGAEVAQPGAGTWTSLGEAVRALVHASLSAVPQPVFDLRPYRKAGAALYRRAVQAASVAPLIVDQPEDPPDEAKARMRASLTDWRRRLAPFLAAYVMEAGDRGYPVLHPMAMQYPNDAEGRGLTDQFLVGDELLAAPILAEGNRDACTSRWGTGPTSARTASIRAGSGRRSKPLKTPCRFF